MPQKRPQLISDLLSSEDILLGVSCSAALQTILTFPKHHLCFHSLGGYCQLHFYFIYGIPADLIGDEHKLNKLEESICILFPPLPLFLRDFLAQNPPALKTSTTLTIPQHKDQNFSQLRQGTRHPPNECRKGHMADTWPYHASSFLSHTSSFTFLDQFPKLNPP